MADEQTAEWGIARAKALRELAEVQARSGDIEGDHSMADAILVELLNTLGFEDVTQAWDEIKKWYA